ncbi:sulfite exporter TauE/SafE family protein [Alteromonas sp. a30]|uniref:sulfite exporter TauE/SafE family protein n=1 Tax=Alteromonas sp. a30 TaxID=2730917 RepID=UPI0022823D11|nr:sulfite exporter TauE/SafE family protein [Alteromonas sp. a30]MCY7296674.1 sulfite exporter TauE/SafE family protein [Alteromonas sp. a30]
MDFLSVIDSTWYWAALALLAGCTIQTAVGFGMALIAAPIIVMVNPLWVPYVLTVTALVLSVSNAWNQRHDIQWQQLVPPMITRIPGTVFGTWILALIAMQWLQVIVAGMVLLTIFVTMRIKPFASTPVNMGIAGFVSGITGTTTSIGGPPMALVMQHSEGKHARANLSIYFVFSCIMSLIGYMWAGLMSQEQWVVSLTMVPVAYLGFYLGKLLRPWVDNRFRPVLLLTCGGSAVVALLNVFLW